MPLSRQRQAETTQRVYTPDPIHHLFASPSATVPLAALFPGNGLAASFSQQSLRAEAATGN